MKTKIFVGCLLATSLLATSCKDFLQEDSKGKLTPGNYYSSIEELKMSNYSLYYQVNQTHIFSNMVYPQVQGDDISANAGGNKQAVADIDAFRATSDNKGVKDCWNRHYSLIQAANSIILNADKVPVATDADKAEVDKIVAQAKYWRAYAYFTLVRLFGPLVMNLDNVNDDFTSKPSSVEDVYSQIVTDLKECEDVLPVSYEKDGHPAFMNNVNVFVTRAAAKSTLSAVYMAMAGYPLNKGTEYYDLAAKKAKEVIEKESEYGLKIDDNWTDVYSMANNYNKETVLGLNFSPLMEWGQDSQFTSCGHFESLGGWGDFFGELKFWKDFPEGPRKDAVYGPKILKPNAADGMLYDWYQVYDQSLVDKELESLKQSDDYKNASEADKKKMEDGITKLLNTPFIVENHPMLSVYSVNWDGKNNISAPYDYRKPTSGNMTNDHRHRLIRYSEVLLWYAESAARAGGDNDITLAKRCLERVRYRAMVGSNVAGKTYNPENWDVIDGTQISSMSNEQLAEAAYKEHGWEVGGYCLSLVTRRSDQFRTNTLKDNFEYRVKDEGISPAPGITVKEGVKVSGSWNDDMNYFPYPDTETAKNPNLKR